MQNKAKQQVDEPTKDDAASKQPASSSGKGRSDAGRPAEGGAADEGAEAADHGAETTVGGEAVQAEAAEAEAGGADASGDAEAQGPAGQAPPEGGVDDGDAVAAAGDDEQEGDEDQEGAAASADAEEEDVPVTVVSVQAHGREETAASGSEAVEEDAAERADAEALVADLASVRSEAASYLDDLRRLQAEFDNYRKRMLREQTMRVAAASQALVTRLLPVLDNFELAISHAEQSRDFDRMLKGVEMVFGELREVLRSEGLSDIQAQGKPFDPACHEAVVAVEEEGAEPGTVVDVVRTGYEFQGKVLRPAMVKVAR